MMQGHAVPNLTAKKKSVQKCTFSIKIYSTLTYFITYKKKLLYNYTKLQFFREMWNK